MITLPQLDRLSLAALEPAYLNALRARLEGGNDAEHWQRFRRTFGRSLILSHLIGRASLLTNLRLQGVRVPVANPTIQPGEFARYAEDIVTGPFWEAIDVFRSKIPNLRQVVDRLTPYTKARAFWVSEVESHQAIARVRDYITKSLEGQHPNKAIVKPSGKVTMVVEGSRADFVDTFNADAATLHLTRNRLQTVFRTNIMGALNEGQFAQIQSPGVQSEVALLMLDEVHDKRTRGNPSGLYPDASPHFQMDRFVAAPHDPVWNVIRPPNGYNCRASISPVTWERAEEMGLADAENKRLFLQRIQAYNGKRLEYIASGEYPDKGFRGPKSLGIAA